MLSRVMTDPTTKTQRKDLDKIFKAVQNNCPELLPEMTASSRQQKKFSASGITGHALNASGPILKSAINLFARKMTLALHYNLANKIVPFNSGVAVEWFTNYQALTNGLPPNLSDMLGPPDTLKQGSFEVSEQFFYQWTISADQNAGIYFAAFRKSFAILGACHPNKRWMEKQDWPTASIFDVFEAPK